MRLWLILFWAALAAGAVAGPGHPTIWLSGMAIPVAGAGFLWGSAHSFRVALLSLGVGLLILLFRQGQAWILLGPWLAFLLIPWLIASRERQFRERSEAGASEAANLRRRAQELQEQQQDLQGRISVLEQAIHEISDLYRLSKEFLGTLDSEEALGIAEGALEEWMPVSSQAERAAYLGKVRGFVDEGDVSVERLIQVMPLSGTDFAARERWGIASGQLALGLQRIGLYRQVQESATRDGLTGLLVRRVFTQRLAEEVDRASRRQTTLGFLMVDLDRFKLVNDAYGHLVGDVVLREVARLIRGSVREMDLVGRYGGEEFGILLPDAGYPLALQIADRIRRTVEGCAIRAYDETIRTTVSVGVALYPKDASVPQQLLEQGDQAMYRAKSLGRNRTVAASDEGGSAGRGPER